MSKIYFQKCQKTYLSTDLSNCLDGDESIEVKSEKLLKNLNSKFHKCFKKIRVTKSLETETDKKLIKRKELKKSLLSNKCMLVKTIISNLIENIELELSEMCAEENYKIISKQIKNISNLEGGLSKLKMWQVRKSVSPRAKDPPMAKHDTSGNLITTKEPLKKLYLETFVDRLRTRDIIPGLNYLKELNEELWDERMEQISENKTPDWTLENLEVVLKSLKNGKARDPMGFTNEIFKERGIDLKRSILKLMNQIKNELKPVQFLALANITTIYKNKGSRSDLNSDRGIFILTCLRSILDKLIYFDKRDRIDGEMSDSNIGGRRDRNIRNHLFVMNGIINDVVQNKKACIDICIYDVAKCFDAMDLKITMNDLYKVSAKDDKLALMYKLNNSSDIAINSPVGMTNRVTLDNLVIQGSVWGSAQCSVQMDSIGRDCYDYGENLYLYKNIVETSPLGMVDDVIGVSKCGHSSIKLNSFICCKVESKKLEFGAEKCKKNTCR